MLRPKQDDFSASPARRKSVWDPVFYHSGVQVGYLSSNQAFSWFLNSTPSNFPQSSFQAPHSRAIVNKYPGVENSWVQDLSSPQCGPLPLLGFSGVILYYGHPLREALPPPLPLHINYFPSWLHSVSFCYQPVSLPHCQHWLIHLYPQYPKNTP